LSIQLNTDDYNTALQSGLGALQETLTNSVAAPGRTVELPLDKLAGGLDRLNADFNLLLGDLVWRVEMQHETLNTVLQEIRLAEFEREARAYRLRAERAYANGWYDEALGDCLEAEKRNYPDFAVLRLIANIYLYHLIDLPKALEYFRKAARYSRPSDTRQSAEAHYFAAIVAVVQKRLDEGLSHMSEAVQLNPGLYEAHYQRARLAVLLPDRDASLASLERAIAGDPRYHERAKHDSVFEPIRSAVESLLESLMQPVRERLDRAREDAKLPEGRVIAKAEERSVYNLLEEIERRIPEATTYKDRLESLDALSRIQQQLRDAPHLFYKQYDIGLQDYVRSQAFSRDGQWLATGLLCGEIKIWEVCTGLNVLTLSAHLASVNSLAFSPNNLWLASGGRDKSIKLWDAETGGSIRSLSGHEGEVRAVAFNPTGEFIVSGSHDRTVRIWRAITGQQAQILGEHKQAVTSAAFSPDGRFVASGSQDKTVRIWDVATATVVYMLRGHTRGVESLALSPGGELLASGGADRQVKIWDVSTGIEVQTLAGLRSGVSSLAFSPDGNLLAAGCLGRTIQVWKLDAGRVLTTLRLSEISYNAVAFSPQGQWLALGSRDLQLWLKVILSEDEYAAVKAGEARARLEQREHEGELFKPRAHVPYFSSPKVW
ncbi:MAG TPA: hypothetical protein VFV34_14630, partial [Blastocatellia bacterium]|nr:hypothetical protein [Blastocatellia bacterium]